MRLPTTLTSLLYLVSFSQDVSAGPVLPKDELQRDIDWIKHLFDRQIPCAGVRCGTDGQYCCTGGSACYTDVGNIAKCGIPTAGAFVAGASSLVYYTTTIVLTNLQTVTSTYSTMIAAPAPTTQYVAQSTMVCASNEDPCGALCCAHGISTCAGLGSCVSIGAMPTSAPTAPLRPTGVVTTVVIATIPPTTTQTFVPVQTANSTIPIGQTNGGGSSSSSFSPGVIAGIVVGVLAAVIILILICFFCVLRAGFDTVLGIFGLGNRRREERVEITEERYSRRNSGPRRTTHLGWFGASGGRTRVEEKRKSNTLAKEGGIIAAILLALGGLWAILGLRKKERRPPRSEVSYTTYTDSYTGTGSSQSSASSDRRTRETRETRVTRESRRVSSRR